MRKLERGEDEHPCFQNFERENKEGFDAYFDLGY